MPESAPTKKAPKKPVDKKPLSHPMYNEMIKDAISDLKERGGSSRHAILKYICKSFNVNKNERTVNNHLKLSLRACVKNGSLKQSKGTGASGSFKLGDKATTGTKKPQAKKAVTAAKPKAAKPKAAKLKADKPKAATKAKKAKSPKKPVKKSPKKTVAKPKAIKKKSPVKKASKPKKAKSPKKKAAAKK